jgi:hypothetical protein
MEETGAPAIFWQMVVRFVRSLDIMPPPCTIVKGFCDEFSDFYKIPKK